MKLKGQMEMILLKNSVLIFMYYLNSGRWNDTWQYYYDILTFNAMFYYLRRRHRSDKL